MILTTLLIAILASLSFVLAAHCGERGLQELGLPTRVPWVLALGGSVTIPLAQVLLLAFSASTAAVNAVSAPLPPMKVLAMGVLGRLSSPLVAGLGPLLIVLCAAAMLVAFVRLFRSARALGRLARSWTRGETAGVRVWISESYGPAIRGLRRPEIVIPRRITDLPFDEQHLAVTHELEHIAARDQWLDRAAAVAVALSAWNPLVWLAARRLRTAIEMDCDARVLRRAPNAKMYASLLLNVASWPHDSRTALALGDAGRLERRLRLITVGRRSSRLLPATLMFAGALGLTLVACDVATTAQRPTAPESRQLNSVLTTANAPSNNFLESQVDRAATMAHLSAAPRYPDVLRRAGVSGQVLVQFVVDADGRPDIGTFRALKSSNDLFTQAVFKALPQMRFVPAEVGGRSVRQAVQQPFAFAIAQ